MIHELKKFSEWKIHLTMKVNFMLSEDNHNRQLMHSESYNILNFVNQTNEIVNELFESLLSRYQVDLEKLMKSSEFFLIMWIDCIINVIKYI